MTGAAAVAAAAAVPLPACPATAAPLSVGEMVPISSLDVHAYDIWVDWVIKTFPVGAVADSLLPALAGIEPEIVFEQVVPVQAGEFAHVEWITLGEAAERFPAPLPVQPEWQYLTVADSLRENGWRHMMRAWAHEDAGRPDWAAGSKRKARINFERACKLDGDLVLDRIAAGIMRWRDCRLADRIAAGIMNGGSDRGGGLAAMLRDA